LNALAGVRIKHPLASHTSFHIGGPADFLVEISEPEPLATLIAECRERGIPSMVMGAGTNLLISDAGVEGLVVRCLCRSHLVEGEIIEAGAGLKMMRLARMAANADRSGLEFAIGIPGTVGGAVYQNAGCWGVEVATVLAWVDGFGPDGNPVRWLPQQLELGYRTSAFRNGYLRGGLITRAGFRVRPGNGLEARRRMAELVAQRNQTQPIRSRSCGSVFVNPPGDSAGRLIEAVGLKGARRGGAEVSFEHANFILNRGGATAADVLDLIETIQSQVRTQFGVELETEVERVGKAG
jgi:UDP-N-acetylmuramate dehydrogenase